MFRNHSIIWRLHFNYLLIQDRPRLEGGEKGCKPSCESVCVCLSVTGRNRKADWMVRSLNLPEATAWEGTDAAGLVCLSTGTRNCVTVCWLASTSLDHLQHLITVYLMQLSFTRPLVGNFYQIFCSESNQQLLLSVAVRFRRRFSQNWGNRRLAFLWLSVCRSNMNQSYFHWS